MITLEELKEILTYNPETGLFTRKTSSGGQKVGSIAGSPHPKGYVRIQLKGKTYLAHRLAWFITYSEWPANDVDHINGLRNDNRILNLREATRSENMQNLLVPTPNETGYPGVYINRNKYSSKITINGESKHLGSFDTAEEASNAYLLAKKELHPYYTK